MRLWIMTALCVAALAAPVTASACRYYQAPAQHLANRLAEPYEAVVAVTVTDLETGDMENPWWRASFRRESSIVGAPTNEVFVSDELGGPGVCWRVPTPAVGERWVMFLTHADDVSGFAYPQALLPVGTLPD